MHRVAAPANAHSAMLLLGIAFATACGGGSGDAAVGSEGNKQAAGNVACVSRDTTPVAVAVREFIAKATPTPQYFLNAAGTDSAVPEDGFKVLQDKGPTYFYTGDSAARQTVRDKLASNGPYASLLVVYHGKTESDGGKAVDVRLGGHYVGGEHDGKTLPTKRYSVACRDTTWTLTTTTDEPAS